MTIDDFCKSLCENKCLNVSPCDFALTDAGELVYQGDYTCYPVVFDTYGGDYQWWIQTPCDYIPCDEWEEINESLDDYYEIAEYLTELQSEGILPEDIEGIEKECAE